MHRAQNGEKQDLRKTGKTHNISLDWAERRNEKVVSFYTTRSTVRTPDCAAKRRGSHLVRVRIEARAVCETAITRSMPNCAKFYNEGSRRCLLIGVNSPCSMRPLDATKYLRTQLTFVCSTVAIGASFVVGVLVVEDIVSFCRQEGVVWR